jgi:transposase-like protein
MKDGLLPIAGEICGLAVKKYAGESAPIQRCQVHKRRNVLDHLTDEQKLAEARKLNAAYALEDYAAAREAPNGLHHELMHLNPSAAAVWANGWKKHSPSID